MDRFGSDWHDHAGKIVAGSNRVVGPDDVLLLPGDLSWAMRRDEAEPDLAFLAALPGIKIAIKGNHDYWWDSGRKLDYPGLLSPPVVLDDGALGVAGTRGWFVPAPGSENESANRKILEREHGRLERSLAAIAGCRTKLAMTHYPPHPFLASLAGVAAVAYGHIHRGSPPEAESQAHDGEIVEGVRLFCVACDRILFTPRRVY